MLARNALLERLNEALDDRDLARGMQAICAYVGAEHYLVARSDGPADTALGNVVTSDWPFDLVRSFAAELVREHGKMNEVERCIGIHRPMFAMCDDNLRLPPALSRRYCIIPFNAGSARLVLMLLFREGIVLSQERLHDAALMSAYHAGAFVGTGGAERALDLTEREIECLAWISEGKTSDEISTIIGISRNTVNNYITSIMRKTATKTRSEAIALAVRNSLI